MKEESINVIIEARNLYTDELITKVENTFYEGVESIWNSCTTDAYLNNKNVYQEFQDKLSMVPKWNQDMIDTEYSTIKDSCEFLDKLIEAVFVSNIKIVSSIKLNKNKQKLKVKIPNSQRFIHKCYINICRKVYENPMIFDNLEAVSNVGNNFQQIKEYIREGIKETIRNLLPFNEILDQALYASSDESGSEPESEQESESDNEDKLSENLEELPSSSKSFSELNLGSSEPAPQQPDRAIHDIISGNTLKDVYTQPNIPTDESDSEEDIRQVRIGSPKVQLDEQNTDYPEPQNEMSSSYEETNYVENDNDFFSDIE